ncbi:MAG: membrane integrity-associated transporter subunit PqiC [Akkermansiaceae bacterium]|nr:membrane integrity-associated transporter subunit PqiC [Akkermansiaceae bacterium]NNM31011.1 membrane integrity-associated transporter subunit PqiC [Akkermansiaceae bacterium]
MIRNTLVVSLAALVLAGCGTADRYYLLTAAGPAPSGGGRGIGVGPVSVAEYLNRSNMVFQSGGNQLEVAENHHWAGDLEKSIASVMAANLGRELGTGNVQVYPWDRDGELSYQVVIDVRQFHGSADGGAILEAGWRVYSLPGSRLVASRSSTLQEPLERDGFDALAAAESRLLMRLAREVAGVMSR